MTKNAKRQPVWVVEFRFDRRDEWSISSYVRPCAHATRGSALKATDDAVWPKHRRRYRVSKYQRVQP